MQIKDMLDLVFTMSDEELESFKLELSNIQSVHPNAFKIGDELISIREKCLSIKSA